MKKLIVIFIVFALLSTTFSFIMPQDDKWKVPEKYEKMKNPVVADATSIKAGYILYNDHCRSCHGKDGKGDGIRARNLNTAPANFTSEAFQKQSEGALLYKIYFGHKDMPGFKTRIPDNKDVIDGAFGKTRTPGDLINYLHTFAKNNNSLSSRNK